MVDLLYGRVFHILH